MYEIKPTFDRSSIQVDLPTCMYKMKTINEFESNGTDSSSQCGVQLNGLNGAVSQLTKSLPDVSQQIEKLLKASNKKDLGALQKRQVEIVKQLEQLRLKLNEMQTNLGVGEAKLSKAANAKPTQKKPVQVVIKPIDETHLKEIVVHVNPKNIPYSLLGLQNLWTDRLNLVIECYTHSSVKELPAQNQQFVKQIGAFNANPKIPSLKLSLIWKEGTSTDLVCAPGTFIPISGEANILRYLIRIGPSEFGYLNSIQINLEIDALFDLVHELVLTTARDHRLSILKRLSQRLNTKTAFGGDSTNVSDIAVFSTLKQLNLTAKELPANVKTWFERNKTLIVV